MASTKNVLLISILLVSLASCVTSRVEVAVKEPLANSDQDGIILLVRRDNAQTEPEDSFYSCVKRRLSSGKTGLNILDENIFMDNLFPWFEPRVAPLKVEAVPDLLSKPEIAERVSQAGVRYIMWLGGSVENIDQGGSMSCDLSSGCFGFAWWENGGTYEASIWDIKEIQNSGIVSTDVKGRSYLPAIVIPIPLIANTKTTACHDLATQLKKQFIG